MSVGSFNKQNNVDGKVNGQKHHHSYIVEKISHWIKTLEQFPSPWSRRTLQPVRSTIVVGKSTIFTQVIIYQDYLNVRLFITPGYFESSAYSSSKVIDPLLSASAS